MSDLKDKTLDSSYKAAIPFITISALCVGIMLGFIGSNLLFFTRTDNSDNGNNVLLPDLSFDEGEYYDQEYINLMLSILENEYAGEVPNSEEITYNMVKGIIASLNDPYTSYLTPEEAKAYKESLSGDFDGIGIEIAYNGENTYIQTILKNTPAATSILKAEDIIVSVDDIDVRGMLPNQVATKIRGKSGTPVKITVARKIGESFETHETTLNRAKIDIDRITWKKLDDSTVRIDITQFVDEDIETFIENWDKIVSEIKAQVPGVKNIAVDLRNNPGGYTVAVRYVLEEFLKNDSIMMQEREKGKDVVVYKDLRKGEFEDKNIVVIVNSQSASASEIFAAAIQDNDRGTVIGEKTVGKGVEQKVKSNIGDDSLLFLVFQEWLTPKGRVITKEDPITPNEIVEFDSELFQKDGSDNQLNRALEILKDK